MAVSKDGGLNVIEQPNSQIHGENNDEPRGLRGIQFSDKAASEFWSLETMLLRCILTNCMFGKPITNPNQVP
jgi:hypothetical protein